VVIRPNIALSIRVGLVVWILRYFANEPSLRGCIPR